MSVREWWRSLAGGDAQADPLEEEREKTRRETTLRTQVRLEAEADAKANTAKSMKELGFVEYAEMLSSEVSGLRRRVERLERQQAGYFVHEAADAFEGRR